MALCRECSKPIPCHCHRTPPTQIRPGVYEATEPHPAHTTPRRDDRTTEK